MQGGLSRAAAGVALALRPRVLARAHARTRARAQAAAAAAAARDTPLRGGQARARGSTREPDAAHPLSLSRAPAQAAAPEDSFAEAAPAAEAEAAPAAPAGDGLDSFFGGEAPAAAPAADAAPAVEGFGDEGAFGAPAAEPAEPVPVAAPLQAEEEPNAMLEWQRANLETLKAKDSAETEARSAVKVKAAEHLSSFNAERDAKLTARKASNREAEATLKDSVATLGTGGNVWEDATSLIETNSNLSVNDTDMSRMKKLLVKLKHTPIIQAN